MPCESGDCHMRGCPGPVSRTLGQAPQSVRQPCLVLGLLCGPRPQTASVPLGSHTGFPASTCCSCHTARTHPDWSGLPAVVPLLRGEVSMPNSTASLPSRGLVPLGSEALCGQLRPPELNGSGAAQSWDLGPKDKEEELRCTETPSVHLQGSMELRPGSGTVQSAPRARARVSP